MIKFKNDVQNHLNMKRDWVASIFSYLISNNTRNKVFLFISISFLLFPSISVHSQDSLFHYLELAGKTNPTVLQKFAEYQAALRKVPQVGSLPDPELTAGIFLSPMELVAGKQVADLRLMQMFPWFGVLKNARDEMSLMAKAKLESFRDAKVGLYFEMQRTWYNLNKIKQNIRVSGENIALLHTIERLAISRFKAGPSGNSPSQVGNAVNLTSDNGSSSGSSGMNKMGGNPSGSTPVQGTASMGGNPMGSASAGSGLSDVYRIQIEIGDLQNTIDLLKNQLTTVTAQFNGFLNRSQAMVINLPDTLKTLDFQPASLQISDTLLGNNPMLGMLKLENQSLEARRRMVTQMGFPMVGIGLNYSLINNNGMSTSPMNGNDMIMPMVTVTLPIYRKKYRAMREEAELLKAANTQNYKAVVNSLQTEYYQAIQLFQDSQRRIKLNAGQYQLASKSLDIMIKSFSSSGSALTDILRVRQQMLDYEFKKVEAVADYNTSIAWIKKISCDDEKGK